MVVESNWFVVLGMDLTDDQSTNLASFTGRGDVIYGKCGLQDSIDRSRLFLSDCRSR